MSWVTLTSVMNAQEAQDQSEPQNAPEDSATNAVLSAPGAVTGSSPPLLSAAPESRDVVTGSLRLSGFFDDKGFNTSTGRLSDYQYSILPGVKLRVFRPRTQFSLDYDGGVTFDRRTQGRNVVTQQFSSKVQHYFTRRLLLEVREDYLASSNPFLRVGQSQFLPSLTGPGQLNPLVFTPTADRTANVSSGDLTYQLDRHSSVGLSGNFSTQRFRNLAATTTNVNLLDSRTVAGRLFFARQVTRDQLVGVQYQLQDLRFAHGQSRTVDQSFFLFDEITLRPKMTLSLFAGPDHIHIHGVPVSTPFSTQILPIVSNIWSPAGGATFTWRGQHTALLVSALRVVSDGGGVFGATLSNTASMEIQKRFTQRWRSGVGLSYLNGHAIDGSNSNAASRLTNWTAYLTVEHSITNNLSTSVRYSFVQQRQTGTLSRNLQHHNQIELALTYQLTRPIKQ